MEREYIIYKDIHYNNNNDNKYNKIQSDIYFTLLKCITKTNPKYCFFFFFSF